LLRSPIMRRQVQNPFHQSIGFSSDQFGCGKLPE
jgi:hypothetical protein